MNTYRKTAISVGVLFIIATVINVLGNVVFLDPILDAPDYLVRISNESHVILGGLLVFFSALASASIAIWLYPIYKEASWSFGVYVGGTERHEVAVGPVHAGVIEPGHFRFQCHGEHVYQLEISLGYQHRGIERQLVGGPIKRTIHYMRGSSSAASPPGWVPEIGAAAARRDRS